MLQVLIDRSSAVAFRDVPVHRIGRGDVLRCDALELAGKLPKYRAHYPVEFDRFLPHSQLLVSTIPIVPDPSGIHYSTTPLLHYSTQKYRNSFAFITARQKLPSPW